MRWHYDEFGKTMVSRTWDWESYECDHPVYNRCTLYRVGDIGLAVIQQRYRISARGAKLTYWTPVDPILASDICNHSKFQEYFAKRARRPVNGIYPTVTVRQIMWALRMKPLKKERWETVFDRKEI